jgi:hypothetical protein
MRSHRGQEGVPFAGAGRRDPGQGGRRDLLVGLRAMEVRSRLWLGRALSRHRDVQRIRALLLRVCACGLLERILLVTDGLSSYKS